MQLLEVCKKDIEVLGEKTGPENQLVFLFSLRMQAIVWHRTNSVMTENPAILPHQLLSIGPGLKWTGGYIQKCFICYPTALLFVQQYSKLGNNKNLHCDAHTSAFHALEGVETWNCCDPPYHPANSYSWRKEDPWMQED